MKKTVRYSIIGFALISVVILALCGFRITYNPSLDNSWEAVSACASWASVIISGLAIWYAVQVPKKIAEEQNRIALFEKRYAFYTTFGRCVSFAECLENIRTCEEAKKCFRVLFCDDSATTVDDSSSVTIVSMQIKTVVTISQGTFLFPFIIDDYLDPIIDNMVQVLSNNNSQEEFVNCCKKLQESAKVAKEQLTDKIEKTLNVINQR